MDLRQIYKVLDYSYNNSDRKIGQSICLVVVPPSEIAEQFPEGGREGEDASPHHITIAYFGEMPLESEPKIVSIIKSVCKKTVPFAIELGSVNKFSNSDAEVYHSQIISEPLRVFRQVLKDRLSANGIEIDSKHPDYTPHMTIEYVHPGEERRFADIQPEGKWKVSSVWLWGYEEPHLLQFK